MSWSRQCETCRHDSRCGAPETLEHLARSQSDYVLRHVARSQKVPITTLRHLAERHNYRVDWGISENPMTPRDLLAHLAANPSDIVRRLVAANLAFLRRATLLAKRATRGARSESLPLRPREVATFETLILSALGREGSQCRLLLLRTVTGTPTAGPLQELGLLLLDCRGHCCSGPHASTAPPLLSRQVLQPVDASDWSLRYATRSSSSQNGHHRGSLRRRSSQSAGTAPVARTGG